MEDKESAQIALAEYYYFSANAELCAETASLPPKVTILATLGVA